MSRIDPGVRYLTDVLARWVAGPAWAMICFLAFRFVEERRGKQPTNADEQP